MMKLFTLPRWAALIVSVLIWPFLTAALIYLLLVSESSSFHSALAGILICVFFREVKKSGDCSLMPKSAAERKAAQRARQAAAGGRKMELVL